MGLTSGWRQKSSENIEGGQLNIVRSFEEIHFAWEMQQEEKWPGSFVTRTEEEELRICYSLENGDNDDADNDDKFAEDFMERGGVNAPTVAEQHYLHLIISILIIMMMMEARWCKVEAK